MGTVSKAEILKLSISERILLVEDIWDSIAEAPEEIALTQAQEQELDARLDAYHRNPDLPPGAVPLITRERPLPLP